MQTETAEGDYSSVITSLSKKIDITNYIFDSSDKESITISNILSNNVINMYYRVINHKIKICKVVNGDSSDMTFQFIVSGGNNFKTWVTIQKNECKTIEVEEGTYSIREIIPQEYSLSSVSGAINTNNGSFNTLIGQNYRITFTNTFTKKGYLHSYGRAENKVEGSS